MLDGLDADNHFHRAGRAEQVAGHRFGGADGQLFRVIAEDGLDGLGFGDIADRRGGAVGVDVIDFSTAARRACSECCIALTAPSPPGAGAVMW